MAIPLNPAFLDPTPSLPPPDPAPAACHTETSDSRPYSMAFQPIVDLAANRLLAYEALVRGREKQSAREVLGQVVRQDFSVMDQHFRILAIELAASLGLVATGADLCVNFNPNTIHASAPALERTIGATIDCGLPLERLILEVTEMEQIEDPLRLREIFALYRPQGLRSSIDDFGAGFAGLTMLAAFQPDIVKIDIALTRKLHERPTSRSILQGVVAICRDLNIQVIAEGIEEEPQVDALRHLGIHLMQGNYFAPPAFESLPSWP